VDRNVLGQSGNNGASVHLLVARDNPGKYPAEKWQLCSGEDGVDLVGMIGKSIAVTAQDEQPF
jgi:hypothetical protein